MLPMVMPVVRQIHDASTKGRIQRAQPASTCPSIRPAMAKEKAEEKPT